jgi:CubicO group peptidase (beta-lactamase class C family)
MKSWRWICGALCLALLIGGWSRAGQPRSAAITLEPAPRPASPPVTLEQATQAAAELPQLHSLLVSRNGELLLEHYSKGIRPTRLANIKSASKSVISALIGIAIDRRHISGVEQPIEAYFADQLKPDKDARKKSITIENLLTMQSGLETTSNRNYGAWVLSSNWVRHALTRPLINPPGTQMQYSTGNSHLLSAILTKATGKSTWQFAQDALAKPLGFTLARWPQDPQGIFFGGNDMLMTPRQMVQFGELYLRHGQINGVQVVPATWVDASFAPRVQSSREQDRYYGYGWWSRELAGYPVHYAWGYGGQFIFVVPKLDLVVVTTSVSEPNSERRSHLRAVYNLVEDIIIPALGKL